jgi:hypothetical protein
VEENELVLPEGDEIQSLADEDLDAYEAHAVGQINSLFESESTSADDVAAAEAFEGHISRVRNERDRRTGERVELAARRDAVLERVGAAPAAGDAAAKGAVVTAGATTAATEVTRPQGGTTTALRELGGIAGPKRNLNPSLRGQKPAPSNGDLGVDLAKAQSFAKVTNTEPRRQSVLTASADIPGFIMGSEIPSMADLVTAMNKRSRMMPVTSDGEGQRVLVASLQRDFTHKMDTRDMSLEEMSALLELAANPENLVATGGWCSPHEISYDFYNIVCIDGLVDLPTVGINRGGLSVPISASFGDISALPGVVWTWTNTQDVAAATGTAQSGVKPCVRVPCPAYRDYELACDGMCVTVGNLTNDAFPELIANHLRLVEAIHAHYMNTRLIAQLVSTTNSTAVGTIGTDEPANSVVLGAAALQRRDYIEKYSMCDDAIVENIYPRWAKDVMREDLKYRTGVSDLMCVTDSMLADWLDCRNIRAQFVADWQVRASGFPGATGASTAWPATMQFLTFPAGTFVRGQGMTLDLGVVRDSVLNATNDFTAAWMEECWLLAKVGHESRLVTLDIGVNGRTGIADLTGITHV